MGNDFNNNKKYNSDQYVTLTLDLDKTCFSQGEYVKGSLYLKGKPGLIQTELIDPLAIATFTEIHHYTYEENSNDDDRKEVEELEEKTIFSLRLDFSNFRGANLVMGVQIPFSVQITNCYPTCIFSYDAYVKHFLTFEFPSIQAKRTAIIVIKNSQYFNIENGLYKSPSIEILETTKHKLLFSKGKFAAVLKLAKNAFAYNENIPFELSIDCTQLDLKIKSIEVSLLRVENKNYKNDYKRARSSTSKQISFKKINLVKGQPKYLIQDTINFPLMAEFNPMQIYQELDVEQKTEEKMKKLHLAPCCSGGLLSVDYFLRIELNFSTKLSTDEKLRMPLDFYVPFDINVYKNQNFNNVSLSQPYNGGNQYQQNYNYNNNQINNNFTNNNQVYNNNLVNNNINNQVYNRNIGNNNLNQNQNMINHQNLQLNKNINYQNNNYNIYPNQNQNNINNNYQKPPLPQNLNNKYDNYKVIEPINNNSKNQLLPNNANNKKYLDNTRVNQIPNNINNNKIISKNNNNVKYLDNTRQNQYVYNINNNAINQNNNSKNQILPNNANNNKYLDNIRPNQYMYNINNRAIYNQQVYNQNIYNQMNNKKY